MDDSVRSCLELQDGLNVIVAVGNVMRADDGVGPYIASRLAPSERLAVFDAGVNPENIVDAVIELNPSSVLFVDAADFGAEPGEARAISKDELTDCALSTHMFPLRAVWEIIERDTDAKVSCLGIQPQDCGFHIGLSRKILAAAETITERLHYSGGVLEGSHEI